jgi:cation:H+ antiporter
VFIAWLQFILCASLIGGAGFWLAKYGDVIAQKTNLGGTWVGVVLIATVTSLPELVTGVASVGLADAPDVAVGDVLGSCVFNLLLIAALDFLYRETPIYLKASNSHILSAGFSIILIGLVAFALISNDAEMPPLGHVGLYSPAIALIYLVAIRSITKQERQRQIELPHMDGYPDMTLKDALMRYAAAASLVVVAGVWMPFAAVRLANAMGWAQSFVGTIFVAAATSLPEAASTIGALRLNAIDLAVGNLFGSNLFNMLVLAVDDAVYTKGSLLSHVAPTNAGSAISAMIMTGAAVVGLHYRPRARVFRIVGWVSLTLILIYVLNTLVLYLRGY